MRSSGFSIDQSDRQQIAALALIECIDDVLVDRVRRLPVCVSKAKRPVALRRNRLGPRKRGRHTKSERRADRAESGGPPGDRTRDTLIKSQVLYH
jgi:hypothetical protein